MVLVFVAVLLALVLTVWQLVLALVGRSTFPAHERAPLREWRIVDLLHNARRGRLELVRLDQRRRPPIRYDGSSGPSAGAV